MQATWLPSRRVAFGLLTLVLVLPLFFSRPRERLYPSWPRPTSVSHDASFNLIGDVTSLPHDSLTHTDFFHVTPDTRLPNSCDAIGAGHVHDVVGLGHLSQPRAHHFHDATLLTDSASDFPVGSSFCVLFLVPQSPQERTVGYMPTPVEGMGPDVLVAEMVSSDVKFVFTEHPVFWGIVTSGSDTGDHVAVYASSYVLNHPGDYQLSAIAELPHYQWTMEDPINLVFKSEQDLLNAKDLSYSDGNVSVASIPSSIAITGKPISRPSQPCFRDGFHDLRGRWYRAAGFGINGHQTTLNPGARLDFAEQASTRDEWGWTFAPDACSLTFFDSRDHLSCFAGRSLQFFGDSNLRRLAKSVVGGGDKWCMVDATEQTCQCKDSDEKRLLDAQNQDVNISRFYHVWDNRGEPIQWGQGSKLYFDFVGGLINPHWANDWELYFNGTDVDEAIISSNPDMHLIAQRQLHYGSIDVVVVSLIVWDVVGLPTPAETLALMPEFRRLLFASYPESTRFVLRLSNSVCCGIQGRRQRFSAPRFQMWNTMWKEFWARDYRAGKVMFHDASLLSGRADVAEAIPCGAPHLSCGAVRLEQQMLMNTVCEKSRLGTARMRDWSDRSQAPKS